MKRFISLCVAAIVAVSLAATVPATAAQQTDLVYANGQVFTMMDLGAFPHPSPGLLSAPNLYVLVYAPTAIPTGYTPQCDPCDHPNLATLPGGGDYHDHVLDGAPGFGTDGTAGGMQAPWRLVLLFYNPAYTANAANFQPITSDTALDAAEAASAQALATGGLPELLPINPSANNPFEIVTPTVINCPLVHVGS